MINKDVEKLQALIVVDRYYLAPDGIIPYCSLGILKSPENQRIIYPAA